MTEEGWVTTYVLHRLKVQGYEQESIVQDVTLHSALMAKNQKGSVSIHEDSALLYFHILCYCTFDVQGRNRQSGGLYMHASKEFNQPFALVLTRHFIMFCLQPSHHFIHSMRRTGYMAYTRCAIMTPVSHANLFPRREVAKTRALVEVLAGPVLRESQQHKFALSNGRQAAMGFRCHEGCDCCSCCCPSFTSSCQLSRSLHMMNVHAGLLQHCYRAAC